MKLHGTSPWYLFTIMGTVQAVMLRDTIHSLCVFRDLDAPALADLVDQTIADDYSLMRQNALAVHRVQIDATKATVALTRIR